MFAAETFLVFMYGSMEEISRFKNLIQNSDENSEVIVALADSIRRREFGDQAPGWAMDCLPDCF
ncbi:MAG: hypothetical protein QGH40_04615 [bacterium]|jgi:hypothetical protein|nr:hypothetical protein [bacterium]